MTSNKNICTYRHYNQADLSCENKTSSSRFSEDAILKSKIEAPREFYSGMIQLLGLKCVLEDTEFRSPAEIKPKILKMYSSLKPSF